MGPLSERSISIPWSVVLTVMGYLGIVIVLVGLFLFILWLFNRRRSHTAGFLNATIVQFHTHSGVLYFVFAVTAGITISSVVFHRVTLERTWDVGIVLTFVAAMATFVSLMNTYYIMHAVEARIYSYDTLLDRLIANLDDITNYAAKKKSYAGEFVYLMAYTPLLGSISADFSRYEDFKDKLQNVIHQVDSVFVRVRDYKSFHETYAKQLTRFARDIDPDSGKPISGSGLEKFINQRNIHLETFLKVNESSADPTQCEDKAELDLEKFPPHYIYVSRTLTVICIVRHEPKKGNEIVGFASEEPFYRDFAYELFPPEYRDSLKRIRP
jgi:hypothetical protein